jgi:two-component system chemotaxis sensor kinase CheA
VTDDRMSERSAREFLAEAGEIVEALQGGFVDIDEQRRRGAPSPGSLNEVFRAAHSLKGLAGMFGVEQISKLAHQMETLLDGLRLGRLQLDDALMQLLWSCTDVFTRLLKDVAAGKKPDDASLLAITQRIEAASGASGHEGTQGIAELLDLPRESLSVLTEYEEHRLGENLRASTPIFSVNAPLPLETFEEDLGALNQVLGALGEVITTLPSADDSGSGINFDLVFASSEPQESLAEQLVHLAGDRYSITRIDRDQPLRDTSAREPAEVVEDGAGGFESVRQVADTVRVDIRKLDDLMGIVGELVLARGGLGRVSDELKSDMGFRGLAVDLHRLVRTMERRIADLQTAIMQVRMVPLGQVFERMARIVRRTASDLGKEVRLDISGEETELDKLIVEELVDPLMHLVRNSVDHGLEDPARRQALGKPEAGHLVLRAFPRGNHVVIEVSDDGRGIDEVSVKRAALERGVVDEERIGSLTQREVWNLIFNPGLSTRKSVSETSGRGVGLDVVKTNISRLSGIIEVESAAGAGTRFTITLPITLAIIQALIVRAAGHVYALPLASVLEILAIDPVDLCRVEGKEMIQLRGHTLPVLRLDQAFDLLPPADTHGEPSDEVDGYGFAAVVGLAQHRVALLVDDVVGQQDIVLKSLGAYLSTVRGIAGATHMGDHETILVLDVAALVSELVGAGPADSSAASTRAGT